MYVYAVMSKEVLNSINFVPLDGKATCSIFRFISVFVKYKMLRGVREGGVQFNFWRHMAGNYCIVT